MLTMCRWVFIVVGLLSVVACDNKPPPSRTTSHLSKNGIINIVPSYYEIGDLDTIKQRGYLRVLIPRAAFGEDLFLQRGLPLHYEMELAKKFAQQHKLKLRLVFVNRYNELIPSLQAGRGDMIAANLIVTQSRKQKIVFTVPITMVKEQIITRVDDPLTQLSDLNGRNVALQPNTSYWETVQTLRLAYPNIHIHKVTDMASIEEILDAVADGVFDLTVADSNIIASNSSFRTGLKAAVELPGQRAIAWAVRPRSQLLVQALNQFLDKHQLAEPLQMAYTGDLAQIKQKGVLRVLTRNNASNYFLWRGELLGFEFELAKAFAGQQKLRLEMVVPPSRDQLITWLLEGKGDVIAASMTIEQNLGTTGIAYSRYYNQVDSVVVTRKTDDTLTQLTDIVGRSVVVRPSSAYYRKLIKLKKQGLDFTLQSAPEDMETEEIIAKVATGEYDITLADSHLMAIEFTWREDVKIAFQLDEPVQHGWMVRQADSQLMIQIDQFFNKKYRGTFYNLLRKKYFEKSSKIAKLVRVGMSIGDGQLSPYDHLIIKYAEKYNFDWRLIVAQIYQESRFNPDALSWVGAKGLMQIMPKTAKQLNYNYAGQTQPEASIGAGLRYLDWIRDRFEADLSVQDKMWFILAAYNAGIGHLQDARRLAKKKGWEPNKWFDNVENAMLLLSKSQYANQARYGYVRGREPVKYVREIKSRYDAYVQITDANASR